jgi:hypothetical protein
VKVKDYELERLLLNTVERVFKESGPTRAGQHLFDKIFTDEEIINCNKGGKTDKNGIKREKFDDIKKDVTMGKK